MKKTIVLVVVLLTLFLVACGTPQDGRADVAKAFCSEFYENVDNVAMGELIDTLSAVPNPEDLQALDADGILAIDTKKQAKMEELYAPLEEYFAEGAFERFISQALFYEYRKQCYELEASPAITDFSAAEGDGGTLDVTLMLSTGIEGKADIEQHLQFTFDDNEKITDVFFTSRSFLN